MTKGFSIFLICLLFGVGFGSCKKSLPGNTTPGDSSCLVIQCPGYFGTPKTLDYNADRQLVKVSYEFNYPGYSTFTSTVSKTGFVESYTNKGTLLTTTYTFSGGSQNFYDGMPTRMDVGTYQKNPDGTASSYTQLSWYAFSYDTKKRLNYIIHDEPGSPSNPNILTYYQRHLIRTTLELTYDDNDDVTQLKQYSVYQFGTYVVQNPSESKLYYDTTVMNLINVTYDNKPSPFTAPLLYWKFVQNDWNLAINSNWNAIIAALSRNNPLTITFKVQNTVNVNVTSNRSYQYNQYGYPSDNYVYKCN